MLNIRLVGMIVGWHFASLEIFVITIIKSVCLSGGFFFSTAYCAIILFDVPGLEFVPRFLLNTNSKDDSRNGRPLPEFIKNIKIFRSLIWRMLIEGHVNPNVINIRGEQVFHI